MDKDYQNFVDRMHSFDDVLDLDDNPRQVKKNIVTRNRSALVGQDSITHFGIRGMKWGKHKAINGVVIGKTAKVGQDIADLGKTVNKGGFNKKHLTEAKQLSDDDLKRLTTRLNLENNYINARQQQQGRDRVERILSTAGSALAVASSAAMLYETIKKFR